VIVVTSKSGTEPLCAVEVPSAALGPGDVRVRVRSIGVNPVDWKMRTGGPLRLAHHFVGPSGPLVVGVDFAGEVVEAGAAVTDLPVGTRVVGGTDFSRKQRGSYADEVVVRPDQCAPLPDEVGFDAAACLPVPGVTAWRAFAELGGIATKPGARVLVLGASGGVGLLALQLAHVLGAVAVGVCSTRNAAIVERFGGIVVDYTAGDPLAAASAHGPFDVVLNAVGSASYALGASRALLRPDGVLVLVAVRPHDAPSLVFSRRTRTILGKPTRDHLAPLVKLLAEGKVEPVIERVFPLAEAEAAHRLSQGGKVVGKVLLHP
jgi:NADPH:quinone reductase-like Zn-dependent oxidoreductase